MVCYQTKSGNANAQRTARAAHFVLLDRPEDLGAKLKASYPDIGWAPDTDGHPTLPFSVGCKLILRAGAERDNRDTLLFAEFPSAQYLNRIWGIIAPHLDLTADEIFSEVARVAGELPPAEGSDLISSAGDWVDVGGSIDDRDWEELGRWVDVISRGDAFDAVPGKDSGLIAAEIFYYVGPFMLTEHRADDTHFELAAVTMGKLFQSDVDEKLCNGAQLATEVAEGMRDSTWPELFTHIPPGNDLVLDVTSSKGGQRIADLRSRVGYWEARTSIATSSTKCVLRSLPSTIRQVKTVPALAGSFAGVKAPSVIADGLIELATALGAACPANVNERAIRELERALSPIVSIILSPPICDLPHVNRIAAIRENIETRHLTVKPSTSSTTSTTTADGEKSTASGKLLISQLTKPGAVEQLQWLAEYRISSDYDPTSLLEMAHSGRWTPEVRAAKVKAVAALDPRARATAEAAIAANDDRAPVPALQQLAWGHVKALEGYPELQDVYDLGQTNMPDVLARLCARAFSADGASVPPALRFARAAKLASALKGKSWDIDLDFINDGDACMLSFLEGGTGTETQRIPTAHLYTDISQLLRVRRIGANVLAFFGVRDSSTGSWRQLVSTCEHAFMGVPSSDVVKRNRLGKAMQRFVTRSLGDIGKRIDLVRFSAKHDAVGPRSLLPTTRGGPADEFAEAVLRIADDQKRKRSEVADDKDSMTLVCLPSEHKAVSSAVISTAPKKPKIGVAWVDEVERKGAAADASVTDSGGVVYSPLVLQMKHVPHQPVQQVTILVDKKGAGRWLQDHGVQKACLGFQFGHACKATRRFASCGHQSDAAHTEEAAGPHEIVSGWAAAAVTFVKAADRKKMAGQ